MNAATKLSSNELHQVLRVAFDAAEADGRETFASACIDGLHELVPSDIVSYNEFDPSRGHEFVRARPDDWMTPACLARFRANAHEHPLLNHYRETGDGRALKISDFLDREAFHASALYREFFGPIGVEHQIALTLPAEPALVIGVAMNRGSSDFHERERTRLNVLRPYLARAHRRVLERAESAARLRALERGADELEEGIALVDDDDHVVYASRPARALLREFVGSDLGAKLPATIDHLRTASDRRLHVRRLSDGSGVVVLSARPPEAASLLTPRELEVLASVADGLTDREIAPLLSISPRTVQRHLRNIYAKLGVHTRAAAVARAFAAHEGQPPDRIGSRSTRPSLQSRERT